MLCGTRAISARSVGICDGVPSTARSSLICTKQINTSIILHSLGEKIKCSYHRIFRGGLPPPDLLYRISTIRSVENYLPNNYLNRFQNSSLLMLIMLNSAFKHISFIHLYIPMLINEQKQRKRPTFEEI